LKFHPLAQCSAHADDETVRRHAVTVDTGNRLGVARIGPGHRFGAIWHSIAIGVKIQGQSLGLVQAFPDITNPVSV
jgi:hypothetical protein